MPFTIFAVALFTAIPAIADEANDRAAIENTIRALNNARKVNDGRSLESLLAADIDPAERIWIRSFERALTEEARRPMSETMLPYATARKILFVTPDVALADVINTQMGGVQGIMQRGTVVLILKREGSDWKIFVLRSPVSVNGVI